MKNFIYANKSIVDIEAHNHGGVYFLKLSPLWRFNDEVIVVGS
jgi:hypothetical protein